ncbi:MAG: sigma-70 family RNA polymerase sigma factor [Planctomycetes bacterium]|nr:sigma-70 family RNA polymerase sigma factor [Planctomycetota bacterium]
MMPIEGKTPDEPDTAQTLFLARSGGDDATSQLVRRFDPALFAAAKMLSGPTLQRDCEPEDLVMEVWVVALSKLPSLELPDDNPGRTFMAFLARTLRYQVNARLRKQYRRMSPGARIEPITSPSRLPDAVTTVTGSVSQRESRQAVADLLETLSPDDRQLVVLHGIEGYPYAEIAPAFGVSSGALAIRYHRALATLRESPMGRQLAPEILEAE